MTRFSIMGGDPRSTRLCELLCGDGYDAKLFKKDEIAAAAAWGQAVVLPLKGMEPGAFCGALSPGQTLVTGGDFLEREDFAVLNAIPTAEGAVETAMDMLPVTLHGACALVIGWGRIGKYLCTLLRGMGAHVTASARNAGDFAWIEACGLDALHTERLGGGLGRFDVIFNTVPHLVLTYSRLLELKRGCAVIDLASAPGGVDFEAADKLGISCRQALGLPGKCSPESAARHMKATLYAILGERGVTL